MGFSEDQERHCGQVETVREWAQAACWCEPDRQGLLSAGWSGASEWRQTGEPGSQAAQTVEKKTRQAESHWLESLI